MLISGYKTRGEGIRKGLVVCELVEKSHGKQLRRFMGKVAVNRTVRLFICL